METYDMASHSHSTGRRKSRSESKANKKEPEIDHGYFDDSDTYEDEEDFIMINFNKDSDSEENVEDIGLDNNLMDFRNSENQLDRYIDEQRKSTEMVSAELPVIADTNRQDVEDIYNESHLTLMTASDKNVTTPLYNGHLENKSVVGETVIDISDDEEDERDDCRNKNETSCSRPIENERSKAEADNDTNTPENVSDPTILNTTSVPLRVTHSTSMFNKDFLHSLIKRAILRRNSRNMIAEQGEKMSVEQTQRKSSDENRNNAVSVPSQMVADDFKDTVIVCDSSDEERETDCRENGNKLHTISGIPSESDLGHNLISNPPMKRTRDKDDIGTIKRICASPSVIDSSCVQSSASFQRNIQNSDGNSVNGCISLSKNSTNIVCSQQIENAPLQNSSSLSSVINNPMQRPEITLASVSSDPNVGVPYGKEMNNDLHSCSSTILPSLLSSDQNLNQVCKEKPDTNIDKGKLPDDEIICLSDDENDVDFSFRSNANVSQCNALQQKVFNSTVEKVLNDSARPEVPSDISRGFVDSVQTTCSQYQEAGVSSIKANAVSSPTVINQNPEIFKLLREINSRAMEKAKLSTGQGFDNNFTGVCYLCAADFFVKDELFDHIRNVHSYYKSAPSFCCCHCRARFSTLTDVSDHENDVHGLSFSCPFCGKLQMSKDALRNHVVNHLRPVVYLCLCCRSDFPTALQVQRHIREEHNKTGEWSHYLKCPVCKCLFNSREKLYSHFINLHSQIFRYPCMACSQNFFSENALLIHRSNSKYLLNGIMIKECTDVYEDFQNLLTRMSRSSSSLVKPTNMVKDKVMQCGGEVRNNHNLTRKRKTIERTNELQERRNLQEHHNHNLTRKRKTIERTNELQERRNLQEQVQSALRKGTLLIETAEQLRKGNSLLETNQNQSWHQKGRVQQNDGLAISGEIHHLGDSRTDSSLSHEGQQTSDSRIYSCSSEDPSSPDKAIIDLTDDWMYPEQSTTAQQRIRPIQCSPDQQLTTEVCEIDSNSLSTMFPRSKQFLTNGNVANKVATISNEYCTSESVNEFRSWVNENNEIEQDQNLTKRLSEENQRSRSSTPQNHLIQSEPLQNENCLPSVPTTKENSGTGAQIGNGCNMDLIDLTCESVSASSPVGNILNGGIEQNEISRKFPTHSDIPPSASQSSYHQVLSLCPTTISSENVGLSSKPSLQFLGSADRLNPETTKRKYTVSESHMLASDDDVLNELVDIQERAPEALKFISESLESGNIKVEKPEGLLSHKSDRVQHDKESYLGGTSSSPSSKGDEDTLRNQILTLLSHHRNADPFRTEVSDSLRDQLTSNPSFMQALYLSLRQSQAKKQTSRNQSPCSDANKSSTSLMTEGKPQGSSNNGVVLELNDDRCQQNQNQNLQRVNEHLLTTVSPSWTGNTNQITEDLQHNSITGSWNESSLEKGNNVHPSSLMSTSSDHISDAIANVKSVSCLPSVVTTSRIPQCLSPSESRLLQDVSSSDFQENRSCDYGSSLCPSKSEPFTCGSGTMYKNHQPIAEKESNQTFLKSNGQLGNSEDFFQIVENSSLSPQSVKGKDSSLPNFNLQEAAMTLKYLAEQLRKGKLQ